MSGVIEGGWGFVWAAYGATALVLGIYTVSLLVRYGRLRRTGEAPRATDD
ncbi:MAG: heme exporter protein CcmD [Thermoanaerobaculia bacterium]